MYKTRKPEKKWGMAETYNTVMKVNSSHHNRIYLQVRSRRNHGIIVQKGHRNAEMRMEACTTQGNMKDMGNGRNIQYSHERSIAITITQYTVELA